MPLPDFSNASIYEIKKFALPAKNNSSYKYFYAECQVE
jgi:hypothetical protein